MRVWSSPNIYSNIIVVVILIVVIFIFIVIKQNFTLEGIEGGGGQIDFLALDFFSFLKFSSLEP